MGVAILRIRAFALKFATWGSNPQRSPLRATPLSDLQKWKTGADRPAWQKGGEKNLEPRENETHATT